MHGERTRASLRLVVVVSTIAAAFSSLACRATDGRDATESAPTSTTTSELAVTTTTEPPTTTTTEPPPPVYGVGAEGLVVVHVQQRLTDLGYRPGPVDGRYGPATASAVMAFQKHEGLSRDGLVGPEVLGVIDGPTMGSGPTRLGGPGLEIDLDRQIMFVVLLDGSHRILNVSTGNNQPYRHPGGYTAVAVTPQGSFAVGRKIDAEERAPLGVLYRPMYFKGGFAVHGSRNVPGYPASHGCVRVSYEDEDWLFPIIAPGTPVVVHGGGEQLSPMTDEPGA
jgi:peptidoglycan hydrolase-like protein with peptidoglycan-binding domain